MYEQELKSHCTKSEPELDYNTCLFFSSGPVLVQA